MSTKIHCQACDSVIENDEGYRVNIFPMEVPLVPIDLSDSLYRKILFSDEHLCDSCCRALAASANLSLALHEAKP